MATSVLTGTILDGAGAGVSGVTVVCTLKPYGFRIDTGTVIAQRQSTTTNGSGVYTFTLEETDNITPAGSWYEVVEQTPVANGGQHVWAVKMGAADATVAASLIPTAPTSTDNAYITQSQGDLRYQPLDSDLTAIAALSTTSFGRSLLAAANATALRVLAGTVIGTDVQAYDVELAAIAGLTSAADKVPYFTGSGTAALATVTTFIRTVLDDVDAATALATLGAQPLDSDLTSIAALSTTSYGRALLTLASASAADWVTKALGTAKGSIIGFSASATPVELTVGANGKIVVADSSQTSGLKWISLPEVLIVALSDETTTITTGTAKVTLRAPYAFTITDVRGQVNTVSTSGLPTVNIKEAGVTIFSTKLTIDANELTSVTAATPYVLSDSSIADDAILTFDIDVAGTGAKGLKVAIYHTRVLA